MKKKFILLIGPSGSGKSSIINMLFKNKELNLGFSVSATTRKSRINEKHELDYYFISEKEFQNKIDNNEFLEWNQHFSHKYGTLKSEINSIIQKKQIPFLEVEILGTKNIIKTIGREKLILILLLSPSSEELKNRLYKRGTETIEQINERILRGSNLISISKNTKLFDFIIINNDLNNTFKKIYKIIKENNGIHI